MIKIAVYEFNSKNFKKSGGLSKRAEPTVLTFLGKDDETAFAPGVYEDVVARIKTRVGGVESVRTPYMFTHIILHAGAPNEVGGKKTYMVFQDVFVNGHEMMTSPTKLLEAFNK